MFSNFWMCHGGRQTPTANMFTKSIASISLILILMISTFSSMAGADDTTNEYRETLSTIVPEFISTGGNVVAKENSEIRLECEIKDLGEHAFMWKFNTKFLFVGNLTIQPLKGIRKDMNSNGIIIEKLTDELTGVYRCEISSNPPKSIQYNVSMPAAPVITPKPANKDNKVVVEKDKSLKLQCNVKSSSLPTTFRWIHNSKTINQNSTDFEINSIQLADSGEITCEATNEIGTRQHTFKVLVEASPTISVSDKIVHGAIGNDVKITCHAKAYPPAKIEWYFANNSAIRISAKHKIITLDDESTLQIHNVDPKDHDNYFCRASNEHGSEAAFFEVTGRPSKPKFTSPQVTRAGDIYDLQWVVFTQSPIKSTQLRFREIDLKSDQAGPWQYVQIAPEDAAEQQQRGPPHRQNHRFDSLEQNKRYEADVEVENEFGKTKSDIFAFSTSDVNAAFCVKGLSILSLLVLLSFG